MKMKGVRAISHLLLSLLLYIVPLLLTSEERKCMLANWEDSFLMSEEKLGVMDVARKLVWTSVLLRWK